MSEQSGQISTRNPLLDAPLFSEGFRVFFPLTAAYGVISIIVWGLVLSGVMVFPFDGDALVFHHYEMFYGFLGAGMVGFLATAVPEWSNTKRVDRAELVTFAGLWLGGRLAFWLMGIIPEAAVFAIHFLFFAAAAYRILPALWTARMKHLVWPVLLLCSSQVFSAWEYMQYGSLEKGIELAEGAFAIMVLTALSAVTTVVVNDSLNKAGNDEVKYIARPPLRRIAIWCIAAFTLAKIMDSSQDLQGWLALAAACGTLNILQDWHMRGALRTNFSRPLYLVYWSLALGLILQALGLLDVFVYEVMVAGEHLIFIGTLSLTTLMVLIIAGLRHSGRSLELPTPLAAAVACLLLAAIARSIAPLVLPEFDWIPAAWSLFALSFLIYTAYFIPIVLRPNQVN